MAENLNLDVLAARHVLGISDAPGRDSSVSAEQLLRESETPLPSVSQAAWTLLEHHIHDIAMGSVGPEEGMRLVMDEVYKPAKLAYVATRRRGSSHDLNELVPLEDEYDEIRRYERRTGTADLRRAGVDAQVVAEAREWMARNGTSTGTWRLF